MTLNNIRRYGLKAGKTVSFVLDMIDQDPLPVLLVEHLGSSNPGYMNDAVLRAGATGATHAERRPAYRESVAKHSVRSFENIFADAEDGGPDKKYPLEVNDENIAVLVESLPDEIFDALWVFAVNAKNFRDTFVSAKPEDIAKK